jgi:hypothetical protein
MKTINLYIISKYAFYLLWDSLEFNKFMGCEFFAVNASRSLNACNGAEADLYFGDKPQGILLLPACVRCVFRIQRHNLGRYFI